MCNCWAARERKKKMKTYWENKELSIEVDGEKREILFSVLNGWIVYTDFYRSANSVMDNVYA